MKKSAIVFALPFLMFFSHPLAAQQSIGFSDSTDFQYLIDYRLPDWGYSNFYLESGSFSTLGNLYQGDENLSYTNAQIHRVEDNRERDARVNIGLTPAYQFYQESEKQTVVINTRLSMYTNISGSDREYKNRIVSDIDENTESNEQEIDRRSYGTSYMLDFKSQHFVNGDFFFLTALETDFRYNFNEFSNRRTQRSSLNRNEEELERRLNIYPQLGIGFGRLRNVAPQLRAIRLNERYKSISNETFTNDEMISAAEHFTKLQGYQRTTGRYQKYFWKDMNQVLSDKFDALDPYHLFYLTDVLNENIGQRLEGFESSLSGTFAYRNTLVKSEWVEDDQATTNRIDTINKTLITSAKIRWYKNLNLNHQLSFVTTNDLNFPIKRETSLKWYLNSQSAFSWLWTITDRYLLTTSLRNVLYKPNYNDSDQYNTQTSLSGQLSYFIENRIALTSQASFGLETFNIDSSTRVAERHTFIWNVSASIRYYFGRNLF